MPDDLDAEATAFLANFTATRKALAAARDEIDTMREERALLTARVESLVRENQQANALAADALNRESEALKRAYTLQGLLQGHGAAIAEFAGNLPGNGTEDHA